MIRVLTEEVRGRLRSGVAVTSVGQCVEELLLNSADAHASCVAVRVDLEVFKVQVVDNGCGLCMEDMDRVGVRYFTSKCHSIKDLENLKFYGFRGEAIASMVDVCSVVEVCSRHKNTDRTFTKLFQNGKPRAVQEAVTERPSPGTTVTLYNLFYNMPVRRKCVDQVLELERIRQKVEAVSLVNPSISFSLKNDVLHSIVLQLPKTKDVSSRFCQIYGLSRSRNLREVQHALNGFSINGLISREGHYNRAMQFLYVNNRFVLRTRLHKLIDFILRKESIICRPKTSLVGKTNGSPGRHRSSCDLYGIFVINIQCGYYEYDVCFQPDKTLIEFQDWSNILLGVEQGVKAFLQRENLFSEASKDEITEFNQRHHFSLSCRDSQHEADQELASSWNAHLKSKPVCRSNLVSAHKSQGAGDTSDIDNDQSPRDSTGKSVCPTLRVDSGDRKIDEQNVRTEEEHIEEGIKGGDVLALAADQAKHAATSAYNNQETADSARPHSWVGNVLACGLVNEESLEGQHSQSGPFSVSGRRFSALSEEPERNISETPPPTDVTRRTILFQNSSLRDTETAGNKMTKGNSENDFEEEHNDLDVTPSVLRLRKSHQEIKGPVVLKYKSDNLTTERPNKRKLIKLHSAANLDSLDKFRRLYKKVPTSDNHPAGRGSLQLRPPDEPEQMETNSTHHSDDSCRAVRDLPPNTLQDMARTPAVGTGEASTEMDVSPLTLSDYVSSNLKEQSGSKCRSSLTAKLFKLKEMEVASCPMDTPTGGLSVNSMTPAEPSVILLNQSAPLPSATQGNNVINTNSSPPIGEQKWPSSDAGAEELHTDDCPTEAPRWLQCYEESLGRSVFINTSTGLSSYSAPTVDRRTACTKDLSNMSVNVVCNNGCQYQCYPFRSEVVIPSLPRAERGPVEHGGGNGPLQSLYSEWKNPVFVRPPLVAVDVSSGNADALAVKIHNILYPYRFTKEMIHTVKVLQQVDNKFIACLMDTQAEQIDGKAGGNLLVLVDQHAAHERVRLEQLIADSLQPSEEDCERRLKVSVVNPPLQLDITEEQSRLLRSRAGMLERVGLSLTFPDSGSNHVLVGEIPLCFVEKEASETHRGRTTVAKKIVEELLQEQVQLLQVPGAGPGTLPGTVLRVLASQACHGAVKFNDPLSLDECRHLVHSLARCSLPFQCAHGRPAILPLADLLHMEPEHEVSPKPNMTRLKRQHRAWQLFGKQSSVSGADNNHKDTCRPLTHVDWH
ncbi:DNA mismatch repair protein Mlh3 isoform X2 [Pseudophryne corroboree]|uniref:DNA mismatch repair protein Mlh3 isoform X2 n=1 Tax=Pseudophryne corroboree TaxID=495146 RepID=UPI003081DB80